jgi:hypothetical protein
MNFKPISFKRQPSEFIYPGFYRDYIRHSNQFHIFAGVLLFAVMWVTGNTLEKMTILAFGERKLALYAIAAYFCVKLFLNILLISRYSWVSYLKILVSTGLLLISIQSMFIYGEFIFSGAMLITSIYSLAVNCRYLCSGFR